MEVITLLVVSPVVGESVVVTAFSPIEGSSGMKIKNIYEYLAEDLELALHELLCACAEDCQVARMPV